VNLILLQALVVVGFPALAFAGSFIGQRVGAPLWEQQIVLGLLIVAGLAVSRKLQESHTCKGQILNGQQCSRQICGRGEFCFQHRRGWEKFWGLMDKGRTGVLTGFLWLLLALGYSYQLQNPRIAVGPPNPPSNLTVSSPSAPIGLVGRVE
jgi:hypothetical protein